MMKQNLTTKKLFKYWGLGLHWLKIIAVLEVGVGFIGKLVNSTYEK